MCKTVRKWSRYSTEFKLSVVEEMVDSGCSSYSIGKKYSIDSSLIRDWAAIFVPSYKPTNRIQMGKTPGNEQEEIRDLKRQLHQKELELKREKMRADAYDTMIDVAEELFNIPIRKKAGTKP